MSSRLKIQTDDNGQNSMIVPGATYVDVRYVTTTAETHTVPTGYNIVLFSSNKDFYVRWDGSAAAVPAADVTDGTGSELNPTARRVEPGDTFSVIGAAADTIVTMAFYKAAN